MATAPVLLSIEEYLHDPLRRAAFTFDAAGLHEADPANLTVPGTSIRVDLTEAFASLD